MFLYFSLQPLSGSKRGGQHEKTSGDRIFYALFSLFARRDFFRYEYDIDLFILFAIGAMFMGWILNLSSSGQDRFLLWTLVCGPGFVYMFIKRALHMGRPIHVFKNRIRWGIIIRKIYRFEIIQSRANER